MDIAAGHFVAFRNLVDEIWTDQPPIPRHPVRIHPLEYAGVAVSEKLSAVRKLLLEARAWSLVVMAMDEVNKQEGRDVRDAEKPGGDCCASFAFLICNDIVVQRNMPCNAAGRVVYAIYPGMNEWCPRSIVSRKGML